MDITRFRHRAVIAVVLTLLFVTACRKPETPPNQSERNQEPTATETTPPTTPSNDPSKPDAAVATEKQHASEPAKTELPPVDSLAEVQLQDAEEAAVRKWLIDLTSDDVAVREKASSRLETLDSTATSQIAGWLTDSDPALRRGVAFFLVDRFRQDDARMVLAFSEALSDQDPVVRSIALSVAKRFPSDAAVAAIPRLIPILKNVEETAHERASAARLLRALGPDAREAMPALAAAMTDDPDESVRTASLMAIEKIAKPEEAATLFVRALTDDEQANVRGLAAVRLGRLGPASVAAVDALAEALADDDSAVRRKAADSLVAIGIPSVEPLIKKLKSPNTQTRLLAVFALGRLGPFSKPAVDALKPLLDDEDAEVRQLAALALQRIGAE